jgi:hypothetical protein
MSTIDASAARGTVMPFSRSSLFLVSGTAVMVALADWLFYDQPVGWTAGLYTAALVALVLLRYPHLLRQRAAVIVAAGLEGLCLQMVTMPGGLEIVAAAMGLSMLAMTGSSGWVSSPFEWTERWAAFVGKGWTRLFRDAKFVGRNRGSLGWLALWAAPLGMGMVFVWLFAEANPIIERWADDVSRQISELFTHTDALRVATWCFVAAWVWALLRFVKRPGLTRWLGSIAAEEGGPAVSPQFIVRCLVVFNAVFAVETLLDMVYLVGGRHLPAGLTYKEYAHRGAYPLVVTAMLAGAFVLLTFRGRRPAESMKTARRLVYLWLAQNVLLMIGSMWRLHLLVANTMITRWRIAAAVWMILVAVAFALVFVRIITGRANAWLVRTAAVVSAAVVYLFCFLPVDGYITSYNARHCREIVPGGELTFYIAYHESLGPEALPGMLWLRARSKDAFLNEKLSESISRLRLELAERQSTWRGWTWRNQRLVNDGVLGDRSLAELTR